MGRHPLRRRRRGNHLTVETSRGCPWRCFVVGLDRQGPEVFEQGYKIAEDVAPHVAQVTLPMPFPGTPFYQELKAEGRLLEEEAWEKCTLVDVNFRPTQMTVDEMRQGFRDLVVKLYGGAFTTYRRKGL